MTANIESCADIAAASELSDIGRRTFIETFGHLYRPEDLESFLSKSHAPEIYARAIEDPQSNVWAVRADDGAIVGYGSAGPCDLPVPQMPLRAGEVQRFYLLASHQAGGIGSRLFDEMLAWLHQQFEHIYLSVYAENFGAQRFYQRRGFEKIHDYFYMVGDHADPEWIMKQTSKR